MGIAVGHSRVTPEIAHEIYVRAQQGESTVALAHEFNISRSTARHYASDVRNPRNRKASITHAPQMPRSEMTTSAAATPPLEKLVAIALLQFDGCNREQIARQLGIKPNDVSMLIRNYKDLFAKAQEVAREMG